MVASGYRKDHETASRSIRAKPAFRGILAATVIALAATAPIEIDLGWNGYGPIALSAAFAKNGNGGNNGNGGGKGNGNGNGNASAADTGSVDDGAGRAQKEGRDPSLLLFAGTPTVKIAQFTTIIRKRYPADNIMVLENPHQAVSFFSELYGMAGKQVLHRWRYEGDVKFEARFDVMSDKWRAWSTHILPAELAGSWIVEVVNEHGAVLETRTLTYRPDMQLIATR